MGGSIKQRGDPPDVRGRSSTTQPDATSIPPLPQCGSSTYTQLARAVLFRTRLWKPKMFARTANFIFAADHLVKVWIVWRLLISRATVAFIACSLYAAEVHSLTVRCESVQFLSPWVGDLWIQTHEDTQWRKVKWSSQKRKQQQQNYCW